jgi:hypothetical protein
MGSTCVLTIRINSNWFFEFEFDKVVKDFPIEKRSFDPCRFSTVLKAHAHSL